MGTTFKNFRGDEIQITPYDAHKEYIVYIEDYEGRYYEPYYEQSRIFNHPLTSSAELEEREVSLSVFTYDAEYDPSYFFPDEYGKYQNPLSSSGMPKTTNGYFKRAIHSSIQGMYYTNPDDPCWTLDNSGYEKEYREINHTAQVISIPQRMFGDNLHKGSIKIQSGSVGNRITLYGDGFGNLYDNELTGSYTWAKLNGFIESASVAESTSVSYVSKSILSLNFSDLYNRTGQSVTAISINKKDVWKQKFGGHQFDVANKTRFFERSRYPNNVHMFNAGVTRSNSEGAYIILDGVEGSTTAERSNEKSGSFLEVQPKTWLDLRRNEDYTIAMRISCSAEQPTADNGLHNYNHLFITHKQDYTAPGGSGYPFSLRQVSDNAPLSGVYGIRGHLQAQIRAGTSFVKINSTGSVTGSGNKWWDVAITKNESTMSFYIDGELQGTAQIPEGQLHNNGPISIGCTRAWGGYYTQTNTGGAGNTQQQPLIESRANWKGGISNFYMFETALTPPEIQYYSATQGRLTNLVGNVFYNHGIITLTSEAERYRAGGVPMLSQCTLSFENSHQILEHEYNIHLKEREYMYTMNPTIVGDSKLGTLRHFVTQSSWSPYITTIGLYDQYARLLAVGKLSRPIKKSEDYDTSFVVRFDT